MEETVNEKSERQLVTIAKTGNKEAEDEARSETSVDWQVVVNRIPWQNLDQLISEWNKRSTSARKMQMVGTYVLTGLVIIAGTGLAWKGIIEGQAIVAFFGAALAYLLAKTGKG